MTADVDQQLLTRVLVDNPAGNAAEQTPLLLIRPLPPEALSPDPPQPNHLDDVDHPTAPPPGMEDDPDPHGGWRPA